MVMRYYRFTVIWYYFRKKRKKMSSKDDKITPKSSTIANDTFEEPPTKKPKVVTGKKSKGFKVKLRTGIGLLACKTFTSMTVFRG